MSDNRTQATPFRPNTANMALCSADAPIFRAVMAEYDRDVSLTAQIRAVGGADRHINHFSRQECRCRPVVAWQADQGTDDQAVKDALARVADQLDPPDHA